MTSFGLPRERFAVLFAVMLVAAAGNTAMQSLLPAIGRQLGVPDLLVAVAFSLSAVLWVITAPLWARRADFRGRRALMRVGLYGYIVSMLTCGGVLALGLQGGIGVTSVFLVFMFGRAIYGAFGSASPPAVQAYVAARTEGAQRTNALAALASSFGLGTIIGPAIAPMFIFEPLGLSAPLIVFAGIGAIVLLALAFRLPDDTPKLSARGRITAYPSMGGGSAPLSEDDPAVPPPLAWRDKRVLPWHVIGTIGGNGQAALLGVIGFLVIDRLNLALADAQQWIAIVLMVGAVASLLAQWWLIPQLGLTPKKLLVWGSLVAAVGLAITAIAASVYGIVMGFSIASLGFSLFRPGFTSGASLAVEPHEQNVVAGMVTSVNGVAFIFAPPIGVALYSIATPLPFIVSALLMLALGGWVAFRFSPSHPAT